ncbi:hypothetical protein K7B09_12445 [Thermomonas sp. RSS23]|uniref:Uncharacterized protein n=1 Tax=Thermomonas beijingensis TaxID=2872701 RepID=A0ABS7TGZ2_9GAMM|nr:hypothetical protein [Thermomonas beijingensis]MBZ4187130.1 hypothetical protein [Thermomonas beijingensis]
MFEITRVQGGEVQPAALHELIHQAWEQFPGNKVFVVLDSSTRPALAGLAAASLVAWEEFKQPYSLWARILNVLPPNNSFKPTPLRGAA